MSRKIVPDQGMLYLEPVNDSGLLTVTPEKAVDMVLEVVRVGGGYMDDFGNQRDVRFKAGDRVILTPGKYQRTARGFLSHQDGVAAKIERWDGEDELSSKAVQPAVMMQKIEA